MGRWHADAAAKAGTGEVMCRDHRGKPEVKVESESESESGREDKGGSCQPAMRATMAGGCLCLSLTLAQLRGCPHGQNSRVVQGSPEPPIGTATASDGALTGRIYLNK
uniref:Uncharacterized protein n=1 Tax=Oryza meridionalis TaxID=40149 RepID=A0A0E0EKV7_9ORYZ